ncbi:MAG: PD-(D/E)XK nuclease domain-containing protein, partial [Pseudobutyrivibrio sp.]|nr:PD-(D/E)XK nuclease domain-containing protein [Pseudobutyrivibrio sp.]
MNGGRVAVNVNTYQNDMTTFHSKDDIFTLLIHLGYLGYDSHCKEVFIPNKEVREVFRETTQEQEWSYLFQALNNSQKLLEATWEEDEVTVAKMVEEAHLRAGNQTYNSEVALSYAVRLAYFNAEEYYTLIPEMQAGKGYADLVYIPSPKYSDKPAILIELKWNKNADSAMNQIIDKKYPDALKKYEGNIILVGINYDKEVRADSEEYKHHSCRIMRA